jgi:carbonic anhydrase
MSLHTRTLIIVALFLTGCSTMRPDTEPSEARWTYPEMTGTTNNWVVAGYDKCGEPGQSPVTLTTSGTPRAYAAVTMSPATLQVPVRRDSRNWETEHHNFGFLVGAAARITVVDRGTGTTNVWTLNDYHFHTPGEHPDANGSTLTNYALELHMKASNSSGNAAVFAVRFASVSSGGAAWFQPLLDSAQGRPGGVVDLGAILRSFQSDPFFAYPGSLTTPSCTRLFGNVPAQFYVLQNPQIVNQASLSSWQAALDSNFDLTTNARGTKPMGTRTLTLYTR